MKRSCIRAACFAAAFALTFSMLFTNVSALTDSGFTHLSITNDPDCRADITIEGNHFTVDGRTVKDPVRGVRFSVNAAEISNYEFTKEDDYTFHAEFDAVLSGDWCQLWLVQESDVVMSFIIQYDENGWSFPDNGLAALNAEKLENIQTAVPEASAFYISQTADPDEIEWTLTELESIVREVCGDEQDDYRKAYLIYRWVAENIYYDKDAAATEVTLDTIAIHNVLERRRTTCAGYSNTFSAMLEIAGIRSVNLKGAAQSGEVTYDTLLTAGENHEFTAFWYEAENRWAYADATWGSNGKYEDGEYYYAYPAMDYFFDVSDEVFALRHRIDKVEERNYTGSLNTEVETEETTAETPETTEAVTSQSTGKTTSTAASTTQTSAAAHGSEAAQKGNYFIYIAIGAAGVVIVIIGIILAIRKTK